MVTITIPGAEDLSLRVNELSEDKRLARFKVYIQNFTGRTSAWKGKQLELSNAVWGGTKIKMHLDPDDPNLDDKRTALRQGLELLEAHGGLDFPELGLEVWSFTGQQACLGYLLPLAGKMKAIVLLGDGVVSASGLVATEILRKNGGEGSRVGKRMQVLTAVLHEFGHCLHAYLHPDRFLACNRIAQLRNEGSTKPEDSDFFSPLPSTRDFKVLSGEIVRISRLVSGYASKHPLELIAEVFSGVLMGESFSEEVMTAYAALGGPKLKASEFAPVEVQPRRAAVQAPIEVIGEGL